jgi:hypothetical protein
MTQPTDDTGDPVVSAEVDEIEDEETASPEETSRSLPKAGTDSDPASFLNY